MPELLKAPVTPAQQARDTLLGALVGLARATTSEPKTDDTDEVLNAGLRLAAQPDAPEERLQRMLAIVQTEKHRVAPGCATCAMPCGNTNDYDFVRLWAAPESIRTLKLQMLSTAFALVLGLPLGVLLVAGDKDGVLPLPGWLMHILNIVINILRSVPFLILMICVFPLTRVIVGTTVGTKATIVPLVVAAFPFVARLVETSLRELDEGVVEAAQSMGATPFQIITKVMIPECLPGLISSMTTALTTILGYSAMSGVIGGGGLGKIALSYGYYRYQTDIMIVCVILLVLMVQVFQSAGTFWATRSDKRLRK